MATPDELRALKLFTWAGDPRIADVWRSAGFDPVPLPSTGIADALRTGQVGALGCSPQAALIAQYYGQAPNMTDVPWQLLIGATVPAATRARWEKLAQGLYPKLRGGIVPAAAFDEALRLRDEYRGRAAARR